MRPSFLGLIATGIISLIALIIYTMNYNSFTAIDHLQFWLLFGILIGIHSILHHLEEIQYEFNPLVGKWGNKFFSGDISLPVKA